jgi:hypothetical protein
VSLALVFFRFQLGVAWRGVAWRSAGSPGAHIAFRGRERLVCKPLYLPICIFDVILMCGPHMHKPLMLELWEDLVQGGPRVTQHGAARKGKSTALHNGHLENLCSSPHCV